MRFDSSRIQEIFAEALLKGSAEARERFLDEVCAGAPELRAQVESLLRAHDQAGNFLGQTIQLPDHRHRLI